MNKKQAEELFNQLADALNNAERTIIQIIENKAWEPLGYATFAEAWDDRLKGVRLATMSMKAHVVYALLEDGLSDADVVKVAGAGDGVVANLREQKERGVPARRASAHPVRAHTRSNPGKPVYLHLQFEAEELARLKARARSEGWDFEAEARRALRTHFEKMLKAAS